MSEWKITCECGCYADAETLSRAINLHAWHFAKDHHIDETERKVTVKRREWVEVH